MKTKNAGLSQAKNSGFSLVELIVVIAIMAILVGIAVPVYTGYIGKASEQVDATTVEEIRHAIELSVVAVMAEGHSVTAGTVTMDKDGAFAEGMDTALQSEVDSILPVNKRKLKSDAYAGGVTFTIGTDYKVTAAVTDTAAGG